AMAREAQAVPSKTPYESYMVTRVIAQAAAGAGEPGVAAKAFDEITGSASAADAERRQFAAAAAGQYYIAKDYAKAAELAARLALDVARLKIETGTMRTANEYLEAAQLSLIDGFPAEAARIIDKGYAAGLLGSGPEAARHKRLKDMAARSLAEDRKSLNANAD